MTDVPDARWRHVFTALRGVVIRRGVQGADVDDVIQRSLEKALARIDTLGDRDRFEPWLKTIAARAAIDHVRAQARSPRTDTLDDTGDIADEVGDGDALLSYADCIRPLLGRLAPDDREALQLKDLDGLAFGDVARRLGLSVPGAKSRVQRARQRLAGVLVSCCETLAAGAIDPLAPDACRPPCCGPDD